MTEEQIVKAVHAAHATGRVALTFIDQNGVEKPTNVLQTLLRELQAASAAPMVHYGPPAEIVPCGTHKGPPAPIIPLASAAPAQEPDAIKKALLEGARNLDERDEINGEEIGRDDMWLVSTRILTALYATHPA